MRKENVEVLELRVPRVHLVESEIEDYREMLGHRVHLASMETKVSREIRVFQANKGL